MNFQRAGKKLYIVMKYVSTFTNNMMCIYFWNLPFNR